MTSAPTDVLTSSAREARVSMKPRIAYVDLAAHNRPLKAELLAAVERVIEHGQFINGPEVAELERALATHLQLPAVVGVSNGTDALVLALRLAGVAAGDDVICPSHSFVATATAIRLIGARPVFADIDEATMNLDPAAVERAVTPRTRAVLAVHLYGTPADVTALAALCQARGLTLVEDCAQAIGASHQGRSVGSVGLGAWSLHPLKVLAAIGDAGFVSVHTEAQVQHLKRMRNIGLIDRDHCDTVDSNMRLDTIHAAMLLAKLPHLDAWLATRQAHARAYAEALRGLVTLPTVAPGDVSTFSTFVIRHPERDRLAAFLRERGIEAKIHYPIPIHRQRAFADLPPVELPVTDRVCASILSLPSTPELSAAQRQDVIDACLTFLRRG